MFIYKKIYAGTHSWSESHLTLEDLTLFPSECVPRKIENEALSLKIVILDILDQRLNNKFRWRDGQIDFRKFPIGQMVVPQPYVSSSLSLYTGIGRDGQIDFRKFPIGQMVVPQPYVSSSLSLYTGIGSVLSVRCFFD